MNLSKQRKTRRTRIHKRVRSKIKGTAERPRVAIYKSLQHIYAQAIDDARGVTLASASSTEKDVKVDGANIASAKAVGEILGKRMKDQGIETAVFDRGGYRYHGRVKALADAVREQGLRF
ncbi:MAG: 50S ribosomal protein L18 [Thermoanaerobaculia bacterium]|nr:50S ribosomal protein L18 [Thermoanaerobaculia bacterium]